MTTKAERVVRVAIIGVLCLAFAPVAYSEAAQPEETIASLNDSALQNRLDDLLAFQVVNYRMQRIDELHRMILDRLGFEDANIDQIAPPQLTALLLQAPARPQLTEARSGDIVVKIAVLLGVAEKLHETKEYLAGLLQQLPNWGRNEPLEAIDKALNRIENEVETIEAALGEVVLALTDILSQLDHLIPPR